MPRYRPPLHIFLPRTLYVGTLSESAAKRLGVKPSRIIYCPTSIYFGDVFDRHGCAGRNVRFGPDGILPDNPPTLLE